MARQQARRRRRERAAGIGVVVLGAVVLVIAIIALREPKGHVSAASGGSTVVTTLSSTPSTSKSKSSASPPRSTTARTSATASSTSATPPAGGVKSVPLLVLNNSGISGLARGAAQRFENAGWQVTNFDNYQNNIVSTCAYYDPDVTGAKAAAEALQAEFPTIKRVKARFADLPAGPVVVVLTSDYSTG